ncbi:MAG: glycosyltransferase family 8 protein [Ruminococcus sp.]|nr:glycosyltransferase family 8 protein [Ruminococcus sp.]
MIIKEIPIFFTIDDAYAPFLAVALNSAVKNSSPTRYYRAFVLHQGLSDDNAKKLKALERDNFRITISPIERSFGAIEDREGNRLRYDYFTLTIYFRLFIPTLFPEYDKGIYIDSDVVLTEDIAKLFDEDLGDNFIGACRDSSITHIPPFVNYTREAIGVEVNNYINSGVLLMNLKKLRDEGFEEHFLNLLSTYHFDSVAPDQDYINAICKGKIHYLDPKWDFMPNDSEPEMEHPALVHYNLFSKPWCYDNIQHGNKFWHYAEDSGYITQLREIRASFTADKTEEEKACLENMLSRAVAIPKGDITFRKIKESGVKIEL